MSGSARDSRDAPVRMLFTHGPARTTGGGRDHAWRLS